MPWWAGFLLFIAGILVGGMICWLSSNDDDEHKYIK